MALSVFAPGIGTAIGGAMGLSGVAASKTYGKQGCQVPLFHEPFSSHDASNSSTMLEQPYLFQIAS